MEREHSTKYVKELGQILAGRKTAEFEADNWKLLIEDGELFGGIIYIRYLEDGNDKELFSFNEYGFLGGYFSVGLDKVKSRSGIHLNSGESTNIDANSLSAKGRKQLAEQVLAMVNRKIQEAQKNKENSVSEEGGLNVAG